MNARGQARLTERARQDESDLGSSGIYWASLADTSSGASRNGRWPLARWSRDLVAVDGFSEVRDCGYQLAYRRAITNF